VATSPRVIPRKIAIVPRPVAVAASASGKCRLTRSATALIRNGWGTSRPTVKTSSIGKPPASGRRNAKAEVASPAHSSGAP
jgi:hypothetical protein